MKGKKDRVVTNLEAALSYAEMGIPVFPLVPGGKRPLLGKAEGGRGYRDATINESEIRGWWEENPNANIGAPTGNASGFFVLDVDGEAGDSALHDLEGKNATLPNTVKVKTGKGRHFYFKSKDLDVRNSAGVLGVGLDIRGEGGYVVLPPSVHESGRKYSGIIDKKVMAEPPAWLLKTIKQAKTRGSKETAITKRADVMRLPEGSRNDGLTRYAGHLRNKGLGGEDLLKKLHAYNEQVCDPPLSPGEVETIAASAEAWPVGDSSSKKGALIRAEFHAKDLTDMGNGHRLAELVVYKCVFCPTMKGWMVFQHGRWRPDNGSYLMRMAKLVVKQMYAEAADLEDKDEREGILKHAKASQSSRALKAMIELAQFERTVDLEKFDANPWLLNVKGWTFNLKEWWMCENHPKHRLTKMSPVKYDENAQCPIWLDFLDRVTGGNTELKKYLKRIAGYCLTGDTGERCLFVLQGVGANGKTTFLNVLSDLLGDYAVNTPIESLMHRSTSGVPNDIARLRGARLVTASEGEMGQKLAESLVKRLTGRDRVTARFLFKEYFEFEPNFKIFLATNHAPLIRGADEGIWDRIRLIPFSVRIPLEERDPQLPDKLRAEMSGIFNWALEGCLEWQEHGLPTPEIVIRATSEYRAEMDILARFLEESTVPVPGARVASAALYARYREWCDNSGERFESQKMFGMQLKERGFQSRKIQGYPHWLDLQLR